MQPLSPTITIYSADGTPMVQVLAESGSKLTANLMQDNYATLNFTTAQVMRFVRGCYCIIPTCADRTLPVKYVVVDEVIPTYDTATGGYKYQMRLDAWYQSWARYKFCLSPFYGPVQTSFSFTQNVAEHVRLIAEQLRILAARDSSITAPTAYCLHYLNRTDLYALAEVGTARAEVDGAQIDASVRLDGETDAVPAKVIIDEGENPLWQLVQSVAIPTEEQADPDTNDATYLLDDTIRMVQYGDINMIEAINAMCAEDAFNCEWWMEGDVMHFGRCEYGTPIALARGSQLASVERAKASQEYGTRLIAFGSDRNVPSRYRKFVALQATNVTNTTDSHTYSLRQDIYFKEEPAEIQTQSEGQKVTQVFPFQTDEVTIVRELTATITLNASVSDPADFGNAQKMTVEVYFGEKNSGGTLVMSKTTAETQDNRNKEINVSAEVHNVVANDSTKCLFIYVTLIGKSAEYGFDGIDYAYQPTLEFSYSIATSQVTKQLIYDSDHKVTSANFWPSYRKAQYFDYRRLNANTLTLGYAATQQSILIGSTRKYANLLANKTYTVTYRFAIFVEIISPATYYPNPISGMEIDIYNLHSVWIGDPHEGLNIIEGAVDISSTTDITTSREVRLKALVYQGASVKIYLFDTEKDASVKWNISSDYYNAVDGKEYIANGAIVKTKISHADEQGNSLADWYDCEVNSNGDIELIENAFSQGDRFTLDGLRNETIKLSWFTDKYGESAVCSYARRLMLPEETCPRNYIDSPRIQDDGVTRENEVVEVVKVFDNIYPEQTLTPYAVECYPGEHKIIDDDGSEQIVHVRRYAMYIKKNDFPFSEQYIPSGMTLQCIFQTGMLSGCGFELGYAGTELLPDIAPQGETDTRYCKFYILPNTDYGVELPNETLHPIGKYYADRFTDSQASFVQQSTADTLIMINYLSSALSEFGYVEAAERRLETAARAYLDKISLDASEYTATLANDYAEQLYTEGAGYPAIGQKVQLSDETYFDDPRETRVIGIERCIDIPYDAPVLRLGESLRYSRTKDILKQLKMQ